MLQRLAIMIGLMLLLTLALQGCTPGYNFAIQMAKVNGKPHMLVEYANPSYSENGETFFTIYTPKNPSWDEWEPVVAERLGRAYTLFSAQVKPAAAPDKTETPAVEPATPVEKKDPPPPAERLGVFHDQRVTFYDLSAKPPAQTFDALPFSWKGECVVTRKGVTYIFGVSRPVYETAAHEGTLMVARFDGQKWEELKVQGPNVRGNMYGFWMQAVETPGGVTILWREPNSDVVFAPHLEGPRVVTDGALTMSTFNGETFEKPITVTGLPRGNQTAWLDGEMLQVAVQTRHKLDDAISHNGPLEIWKVGLGGGAERVAELEGSRGKGGLLSYLLVEHFADGDADYLVRSNLQLFEIWRKTPETSWTKVAFKPRGLPVYDLESVLLGGIAVSIGMVAFGVGLAYHRRRQAVLLVRKVSSKDIYASLGLRIGAYAVDLFVVIGATCILAKTQSWPFVSPVQMLDFISDQYWPFFGVYMIYFVTTEWLFGASLGKFIMGLCVVMDGGERLSFWSALVRNLVGFFERLPYVFILVTLWMIILGPRRQRMGDVLSRSFVMQKGALEVFKTQRAQDIALRKANQLDTRDLEKELLPPVDAAWDSDSSSKKSERDKGPRS